VHYDNAAKVYFPEPTLVRPCALSEAWLCLDYPITVVLTSYGVQNLIQGSRTSD